MTEGMELIQGKWIRNEAVAQKRDQLASYQREKLGEVRGTGWRRVKNEATSRLARARSFLGWLFVKKNAEVLVKLSWRVFAGT